MRIGYPPAMPAVNTVEATSAHASSVEPASVESATASATMTAGGCGIERDHRHRRDRNIREFCEASYLLLFSLWRKSYIRHCGRLLGRRSHHDS